MNMIDDTVKLLMKEHPDQTEFRRKDIINAADRIGLNHSVLSKILLTEPVAHGIYSLSAHVIRLNEEKFVESSTNQNCESFAKPQMISEKKSSNKTDSFSGFTEHTPYIPEKNLSFVEHGEYGIVKKIIQSEEFFPIFISGMSGLGKTQMIKHICASLKRSFIRVQITPETDEMDLIGSLRLVDGSTVFAKGPVIAAMEAGAILLIDEIDRGSHKTALSLQGVAEGEPVLIKKTGELVHPKHGFNIIATGNTKGRGSLNGRYTAATIVDEAFLERFYINIEQSYPKKEVVQKILNSFLVGLSQFSLLSPEKQEKCKNFAEELSAWGDIINTSFNEEAIDETLSIRRLLQILKTFTIFTNELKAIKLGITRYDEISQEAFLDLYRKISKINFAEDID